MTSSVTTNRCPSTLRGFRVAWRVRFAALVMLLAHAASSPTWAAVSASLDRTAVRLGETVRLVLTFDDEAGPASFDTAPLEADFNVLGSSTSSEIRMTGDERQVTTQLRVDLLPRREGRAVVPPLVFPGGRTEPVELEVLPPGTGDAGEDVFLEVEAEPRTAYLQAPVYVSVRLFYRKSILEGNLSDPVLDDALVRRFGEDTQYRATRGSQAYRVIERRFVIFPQASGTLDIEPFTFVGRVAGEARAGSGIFGGLFTSGLRVSARSSALEIDVRPPPAGVVGPWFPAGEVSLNERWPDDPPRFVVGVAVTRTLRVEALGATGEQVPPIAVSPVDGIRHYPDKPVIETTPSGDALLGVREQRIAMVPLRPGTFTLPAVEVSWWDTAAERARVARLPARPIHIEPAAGTGAPSTPSMSAGVGAGRESAPARDAEPVEAATASPRDDAFSAWPWIALALSGLWLVTLAAWWRERQSARPRLPVRPATPASAPRLSLRKACRDGDPAAVRAALLDDARRRWPGNPPAGLGALAARLDDPAVVEAISRLDAAVYGRGRRTFDGEAFYRNVAPALKPAESRRPAALDVLPPLYPARRANAQASDRG